MPARLFGRWFGTPGPDEDTLMAWTLAIFEDIFVNVKNDPRISAEAETASKALAAYLDEAIAARKAQMNGAPPTDVVGRLLAMQAHGADRVQRRGDPRQRDRARVRLRPDDRDRHDVRLDALLERPEALAGAQAAARADDDDAVRAYMFEAMRLAPQGPGCSAARARTSRSPRARCTRRRSRRGR